MKIQNLALLQSRITNFTWSDLASISSFKYYMDKNKHYEDISMLDIEFLSNKNEINLRIQIRFKEIESFSINASGRIIQLGIFDIVDIKEDGWCALKRNVCSIIEKFNPLISIQSQGTSSEVFFVCPTTN